MNTSIWLYMTLSKTFATLNKTLSFLYLIHRFLKKTGLTVVSLLSSGKHPFSNEKLLIFVISERCISNVTLSMSSGRSTSRVTLESSILKIICCTCSSITCWKENFFIAFVSFSDLANTRVKNTF